MSLFTLDQRCPTGAITLARRAMPGGILWTVSASETLVLRRMILVREELEALCRERDGADGSVIFSERDINAFAHGAGWDSVRPGSVPAATA